MKRFISKLNSVLMDASAHGTGRAVLVALLCGVMSMACSESMPSNPAKPAPTAQEQALAYKFRGIYGVATRIDAASPTEGVTIATQTGSPIDGSAVLSLENAKFSSYGGYGFPIPITVRATWREGDFKNMGQSRWEGGTIAGDYTVPVAERIPDEVLDYIRKNGGGLRLKIRLHDKGVAIGWDVEMRLPIPNLPRDYQGARNYHEFRLAGGDFREDWFNSDTRELVPGWKKY